MFIKGKRNLRISKHYHVIYNYLERCLRDLLCDMLLMLVLMYRLLSVILFITISEKGFEVNNCKDLA
jgi:hypothetical protein